jgi:hypothetical protein
MNRALYLDESKVELTSGFAKLKSSLESLMGELVCAAKRKL